MLLGDSLCLPRNENEKRVRYECLYPVLLNNSSGLQIINFSRRSKTIVDIRSEIGEIVLYEPKVVILHIGIVDCAPRIFSKKEKIMYSRFPRILRDFVIRNRKKRRTNIQGKNPLRKVYVNPELFKKTYLEVISMLRQELCDLRIIIIPISGYLNRLELKSKGFKHNIDLYNQLLYQISNETNCELLNNSDMLLSSEYYVDDYYHLSETGHIAFFERLLKYF
jgi:lysophospholipase L1-like esterase